MLLHAFAQLGPPDAALERNSFFNDVGYEVAGQCLSFRDLEHGVLRGNVVPPGPTFSRPFGSGDPRLAFVIPLDNRIHFGLNCGAASCPPIKDFTAEAIDEELRIVYVVDRTQRVRRLVMAAEPAVPSTGGSAESPGVITVADGSGPIGGALEELHPHLGQPWG